MWFLWNLIHPSRRPYLQSEYEQPYFSQIEIFLSSEYDAGHTIYPPRADIFKAFELTPWDEVKVVILWQDPYHGEGQAMGLSFSVPDGVRLPPSLRNIYKELELEWFKNPPFFEHFSWKGWKQRSWDLTGRAEQWVLLLNSILTVRAGEPASHSKIWRQYFTDAVIRKIAMKRTWVVFMLRWNYAISKSPLIDETKHLILKGVHPSPLSASRGWFGCDHFRLCNEYLSTMHKKEINW